MLAEKPTRNLLNDLVLGIGAGLAIAICLCFYAGILYLFRGPKPFESNGTTLGTVILLYLVGGTVAGAVLGLLFPFTRWRWGAALVGFVAAMPVFVIFRFALEGFTPWTKGDTIVMSVWALTLGSTVGWIFWGMFRRPLR